MMSFVFRSRIVVPKLKQYSYRIQLIQTLVQSTADRNLILNCFSFQSKWKPAWIEVFSPVDAPNAWVDWVAPKAGAATLPPNAGAAALPPKAGAAAFPPNAGAAALPPKAGAAVLPPNEKFPKPASKTQFVIHVSLIVLFISSVKWITFSWCTGRYSCVTKIKRCHDFSRKY